MRRMVSDLLNQKSTAIENLLLPITHIPKGLMEVWFLDRHRITTCRTDCPLTSSNLSMPSDAAARISAHSFANVAKRCSGAICFSKETQMCILLALEFSSLPLEMILFNGLSSLKIKHFFSWLQDNRGTYLMENRWFSVCELLEPQCPLWASLSFRTKIASTKLL